MKKILCSVGCIVISSVFCNSLLAQHGGWAGEYLRQAIGNRNLAMGQTWAAGSRDALAVFTNPSGLLQSDRNGLSVQYSTLLLESLYSVVGGVIPRIGKTGDWALGVGFVSLSSDGFEERDLFSKEYGTFGMGESAIAFTGAREFVSEWGILQTGVTLKGVNQRFTGLENYSTTSNGRWSLGMDVGIIFHPIHAPVFRLIPLRWLLPLKLGFTIQNFIQPSWKPTDISMNHFPRVLRMGAVYTIPWESWLLSPAIDFEWMQFSGAGLYAGAEASRRVQNDLWIYFRTGGNSSDRSFGLGGGVLWKLPTPGWIALDYTWRSQSILPDDNRFQLTFQLNKDRGVEFFKQLARLSEDKTERRNQHFRILTRTMDINEIENSASYLAENDDERYRERYTKLAGGLHWADMLYRDAITLIKSDDAKKAKDKAGMASRVYQENRDEIKDDNYLIHWGECLIIQERYQEAIGLLDPINTMLKAQFLTAVSQQALGELDTAKARYQKIMESPDCLRNEQESLIPLTFLNFSKICMKQELYITADTTLSKIQAHFSDNLDPNYPPYPWYSDSSIGDDVQFLRGLAQILSAGSDEQIKAGLTTVMATQKLYPNSVKGLKLQKVENGPDTDRIIQWLGKQNTVSEVKEWARKQADN